MRKLLVLTLLSLAVVLIAARVALPVLAERRINASLGRLEGYQGKVGDVDLSLLRGRITLEGLAIRDTKEDFGLSVPKLALDVSWKDLLRKTAVVSAVAYEPVMSLTAPKPAAAARKAGEKAQKTEREIEKKAGRPVDEMLRDAMPFRVERFEIIDGRIALREGAADEEEKRQKTDADRQPDEPLQMTDIHLLVEDLTNTSEREPAKATLRAGLAGGTLKSKLALRPLAKTPTFDLNAAVENVDLARLSPMLRWQWNVDVEAGKFEMVAEAKAADGAFKGYVKPFITGLKAAPAGGSGPVKKVKQAVVGAVAKVLENDETDRIATRVPFQGRFDNPDAGVWEAVVQVLRNAFIEALRPRFDRI